MINEIKLGAAPPVERDAVDMLTACHSRIRNFTGIAGRLAEVQGAAGPEIANAAAAVHRYYSVALPLHEADENESVYPRLRQILTLAEEQRAVEDMVEQHGPLNEVIRRLLPRWDELRNSPEKLAGYAAQLREDSRRLQQLWDEHLALEEKIVFPLIRERLSEAALRDIHGEMKRRRGVE